jgi:hypothetical protein
MLADDLTVDAVKDFQVDEEAYRRMREDLLKRYKGKWVAVHEGGVVAVGDQLSEVIKKAFSIVGDSPFYINKVGEEAKVGRRVYRFR